MRSSARTDELSVLFDADRIFSTAGEVTNSSASMTQGAGMCEKGYHAANFRKQPPVQVGGSSIRDER
jgi:hypothetical protein